jgi:hypothetical protein
MTETCMQSFPALMWPGWRRRSSEWLRAVFPLLLQESRSEACPWSTDATKMIVSEVRTLIQEVLAPRGRGWLLACRNVTFESLDFQEG